MKNVIERRLEALEAKTGTSVSVVFVRWQVPKGDPPHLWRAIHERVVYEQQTGENEEDFERRVAAAATGTSRQPVAVVYCWLETQGGAVGYCR